MGISSHELVPSDNHPEPRSKSIRALVKHIEKRQLQTAIRAIDREYDRVDHTHLTETVLGAAERDIDRLAEFVRLTREIVDGDELVAEMVAPVMNIAGAAVRGHFRDAFGLS